MAADSKTNTVKINGQDYNLSELSAKAKTQLGNLRATDVELQHLKVQVGIAQTARNAYLSALLGELPKK